MVPATTSDAGPSGGLLLIGHRREKSAKDTHALPAENARSIPWAWWLLQRSGVAAPVQQQWSLQSAKDDRGELGSRFWIQILQGGRDVEVLS